MAVARHHGLWVALALLGCERSAVPEQAPQEVAVRPAVRSPSEKRSAVAGTCARALEAFEVRSTDAFFERRYRGSNGAVSFLALGEDVHAWLAAPGKRFEPSILAVATESDFSKTIPFERPLQAAFLEATDGFATRTANVAEHDIIGFVPQADDTGRALATTSLLRTLVARVHVLAVQKRAEQARAELLVLLGLADRLGLPSTFLDLVLVDVASHEVWQAAIRAAFDGTLDEAGVKHLRTREGYPGTRDDALVASCRGDIMFVCGLAESHPERFADDNAADFDRRLDACLNRDWQFSAWVDLVQRHETYRLKRRVFTAALQLLAEHPVDDTEVQGIISEQDGLKGRKGGRHWVIESTDPDALVEFVVPQAW
jgi:hypothetical protein